MSNYNDHYTFLAFRCYEGKLDLRKQMLWKVPTHPPLYSNREDIEGLGLCKEEGQALQKALKSQLSVCALHVFVVRFWYFLQFPYLTVHMLYSSQFWGSHASKFHSLSNIHFDTIHCMHNNSFLSLISYIFQYTYTNFEENFHDSNRLYHNTITISAYYKSYKS